MLDATSFIEEFHGLAGHLLKEKKKSLQVLLTKYRSIENNEEILKEINTKLQPETYLEETYKLEFLLHFRRVQELFEFIKNENHVMISKIIRQKWFLTAILKDVSPQKFVSEIFPQLSLVVRLKILKQILKHFKDENFIETLFQELLYAYGWRYAQVIISGCSVEKIKQVLTGRGLNISMAQLKLLFDKDKSLIRFYYDEYYRRGGNLNSLDSFSHYLSRKDHDLFMELYIKYNLRTNYILGRQATSSYIRKKKQNIIDDPQKYLDLGVLKQSVLVRELGNDFPVFLKAAFPESIEQLGNSHIVMNLLDDYPKKRRYNLLCSLFKEVYNKDLINERKELMTEKLLETITSYEEREKWVEALQNEVKYIRFKRSTLAVPELKELLFKTDNASTRSELFNHIITACGMNEDYDSLLDILKLICKRYRNDDSAILTVLEEIKTKLDLHRLTEEHWKYIQEIILIQDLKNYNIDGEMVMEYCKFLYKSKKSFEDLIPILIKPNQTLFHIKYWEFTDKQFHDEKFQEKFIKLLLKHYSNVNEECINYWAIINIVLMIKEWNKNHPSIPIFVSREENMVEYIRKEFKSRWILRPVDEMKVLKYLICYENANFEDVYFENIQKLSVVTITKWFLKYKPEIFEKYLEDLSYAFNNESRILIKTLKKLEYLGISKAILPQYLEKLEGSDQISRDQIFKFLFSVMPSKDYLELLRKYAPETDKLVLAEASDEEKTRLQIQMSLAESVRFTTCHNEAWPIIFKYCKGDCLQPALHSLYSCFNRIPENLLKPYISELKNKQVSLRKHAIFLIALVFPVNINDQFGQEMVKNERDISVKKHLFTSSYKYFLNNPLDQFWNILQANMEFLTVNDKESLDLISNIHQIPEQFKGRFAEKVWKVFNELDKKKNSEVKKYYDQFFNSIQQYDIAFLAPNFCIEIIRDKLFEEGHKRNPACSEFSIHFMMFTKDTKQAVEEVVHILQEYKTKYWKSEQTVYAKSTLYNFCSEVFEKIMNIESLRINLSQEFLQAFSANWKLIFTQQEAFEEYLMLEFMLLKHTKNLNLQFIAQKIGRIFENSTSLYGEFVLDLVQEFMKNYLNRLLGTKNYNEKLMELLKYFAEEDKISTSRCLLIISLLPTHIHNTKKFKENRDFVLSKIDSNTDCIVSMHLDKHHKSSL